MIDQVNALARTTGSSGLMAAKEEDGLLFFKKMNGYSYVKDKFSHAQLTPLQSEEVHPSRILECPAQMEAKLEGVYEMTKDANVKAMVALEVRILRTYVHKDIRMEGHKNRIDPDKWRPMIMSFQELYGLNRKLDESVLAKIPEEQYRPLASIVAVENGKETETEMDGMNH
jgi:flavin reductase (DIM6/NTAB) family NADH-FMN oxidoreductase RutF